MSCKVSYTVVRRFVTNFLQRSCK